MFKKYDITGIRVLQMIGEEFPTLENARNFFNYHLPKVKDGKYSYRERGIAFDKKDEDILVLFSYKKEWIACGIAFHSGKTELPRTVVIDGEKVTYVGEINFYPDSIFNIDKITKNEYLQIVPQIEGKMNAQGVGKIDMEHGNFENILNLTESKWKDFI